MIKGFSLVLLASLALFIPTSGAHAGFIIGNLDGNDGTGSRSLVGGRTAAMGFTMAAGSNYLLTDAILRLKIRGDGVVPTIQIWSNGGSNVPTTLLTTLTNPLIPNSSSIIADLSFAPSSPFALVGGMSYWLVASDTTNANTSVYDWLASNPGVTPTGLATHLGSLFGTQGVPSLASSPILSSYQIDATIIPSTVPEPASVGLMGLGLLGTLGQAWRRHAAARVRLAKGDPRGSR
jgi:hypothetical protein